MDYKKVENSYVDSISQYDLNEILKNSKHGELNFVSLQSQVNEMAKVIYELELQDYRTILPRGVVNEVDSFRSNLIQYINLIKDFTITQQNASEVRNSYINQIQSFYNSGFYRTEEILNNLKVKQLLSHGESKKTLEEKNILSEEIKEVKKLKTD